MPANLQGGAGINPHATQTLAPVDLPLVADRPSRYVAPPSTSPRIGRVAIITLGCKLNQADSESIARQFTQRGVQVIDRPAIADAYVINTCSVTHVADRKARRMVRLARRLSPNAPIVLTGCYLQTAPADIARELGADIAIHTRDKASIADRIGVVRRMRAVEQPTALRTRAFVKVQEGCNDVCAFCIVPKTRGREVSEPIERVVREVQAREREGVQEVVLTGTQLGAYGRDAGTAPADVIAAVLAETSVPRIRFSSLQPQDITPALLGLWDDPRLCRHFHLALQSGSDATLRRMRRRYDVAQYRDAAQRIRAHTGDGVAITTDVIVGFPGETDVEFEESIAFCLEMGFAQMHVFPYSKRSGTVAARLPDQVPHDVKHARMQRMLAVAPESRRAFLDQFAGRVMPVLWERSRGDANGAPAWDGLTDNYIRVTARSHRELRNQLTVARLVTVNADGGFEGEAL
ncbi:MAG: tRNA (N(6)-L-threonylcarbamoyladenosine(37)-C(2))-methylthiotransferase MtaB [Dehalococcoidia bacterium]